jgi:predicted nucleic acid-binding protein
MSDLVLDASLSLQWFLKTRRTGTTDSLSSRVSPKNALWFLWFYEVGKGLRRAHRRKRISLKQVDGFLTRLKALPIDATREAPFELRELPALARSCDLTNHDAAYLGPWPW